MRTLNAAALLLLASGATALAAPAARAQDGAFVRGDSHSSVYDHTSSGYGAPDERYRGGYDDDGYQRVGVRVWLENDRDLFRPGELTRVLVRPTQDAYVAVLNITPDGDVEFLWPRDYYDDGFMRGGAAYGLGTRTGSRYLRVGYGYGIGYVLAVASDEPLDLRRARDYYYRRTSGWDAGLNVYGDPFRAMERLARMLVPDYDDGYGAVDWYTYHVGSQRYRYPRYACSSGYGAWYTSRSPYYDGCDQVRVLLGQVPYYYDTRYYRGDRSRYWRRGDDFYDGYARSRQPQHGYKESTYPYDRASGSPNRRPLTRSGADDAPPPRRIGGSGNSGVDRSGGGGGGDDVQAPTRSRPTLQRRPQESEPVRVQRPQSSDGGSGVRERSEPPPRRIESQPRAEPRGEPRSEPRTSPPPPRSEPRSAPPPSRAPASSEPRVRPSTDG